VTLEERLQAETGGLLLTAPPPLLPTSAVPEKKTSEEVGENATEQFGSTMESVASSELDMDMTESDLTLNETMTENNVNEKGYLSRKKSPDRQNETITELTVDSQNVKLRETNQIRSECGLKPLSKCKLSAPVRNLRSPLVEHERLIRNAVLRLLKTLSPHSLEIVIHAAERRLSRFDHLNSPQPPNGIDPHIGSLTAGYWVPSDDYDHTNYMDYSR
ncbi:hypothetical protein P879_03447, partial [Paragonimus westermani]